MAGLPITSLLSETPLAAIWKRAVSGQADVEVVKRPAHVVYSVTPSVRGISMSRLGLLDAIAYGYKTERSIDALVIVDGKHN